MIFLVSQYVFGLSKQGLHSSDFVMDNKPFLLLPHLGLAD